MANIVTARELGQYLKLSGSTIYKLASGGELPGFKVGDSWRFDMDEIAKVVRRKMDAAREGLQRDNVRSIKKSRERR